MKFELKHSLGLALLAMWTSGAMAADFYPCVDARSAPVLNGTLCASELLPLSYAAAQLEGMDSVTLFLRQFPAVKKSRGAVWLVADGPGESGAALYPLLAVIRRSFPDFDIIVPDHRGTGLSSRLCPVEEAADSPGGGALDGAEAASCARRLNGAQELVAQYTFSNGARDLRYLMRQVPSDKPAYVVGIGYGAQLVLRALQLGKLPVAGIVLDSLPPLDGAWAQAPSSGGSGVAGLPQSPPSAPLAAIIARSENAAGPQAETQAETQAAVEETQWPSYARDPLSGGLPAQMPPLLVLSGTRDTEAPRAGAVAHVAALRAVAGAKVSMVSVTDAPHAIAANAPACFEREVKAFVAGTLGADTSCAAAGK